MKSFSFSFFIGFVVLMFTHLQAQPIQIENSVFQTVTNVISNDKTDLLGFVKTIDLFDIEEDSFDDEKVLKTALKVTLPIQSSNAYAAFNSIFSKKIFIPKTPSFLKFYKTWQSYLQVFRL